MAAAMELYGEHGFEQTTAQEVAQRAGVTERTFFRHFADKREVLFSGSQILQDLIVTAIAQEPPELGPVSVVGSAMESAGVYFERDQARRRNALIVANPSLHERELLKLANLTLAVAQALRDRGVDDLPARLAAEVGVTAFAVGFEIWIADDTTDEFAVCVRKALDHLREIVSGT
jgi:AcrR family transcriptional regulator